MNPLIVNFEEANRYAENLESKLEKTMVSYFLTRLVILASKGRVPNAPFDALHFAKTVKFAFENEAAIRLALNGESLDWWDSGTGGHI